MSAKSKRTIIADRYNNNKKWLIIREVCGHYTLKQYLWTYNRFGLRSMTMTGKHYRCGLIWIRHIIGDDSFGINSF